MTKDTLRDYPMPTLLENTHASQPLIKKVITLTPTILPLVEHQSIHDLKPEELSPANLLNHKQLTESEIDKHTLKKINLVALTVNTDRENITLIAPSLPGRTGLIKALEVIDSTITIKQLTDQVDHPHKYLNITIGRVKLTEDISTPSIQIKGGPTKSNFHTYLKIGAVIGGKIIDPLFNRNFDPNQFSGKHLPSEIVIFAGCLGYPNEKAKSDPYQALVFCEPNPNPPIPPTLS